MGKPLLELDADLEKIKKMIDGFIAGFIQNKLLTEENAQFVRILMLDVLAKSRGLTAVWEEGQEFPEADTLMKDVIPAVFLKRFESLKKEGLITEKEYSDIKAALLKHTVIFHQDNDPCWTIYNEFKGTTNINKIDMTAMKVIFVAKGLSLNHGVLMLSMEKCTEGVVIQGTLYGCKSDQKIINSHIGLKTTTRELPASCSVNDGVLFDFTRTFINIEKAKLFLNQIKKIDKTIATIEQGIINYCTVHLPKYNLEDKEEVMAAFASVMVFFESNPIRVGHLINSDPQSSRSSLSSTPAESDSTHVQLDEKIRITGPRM